LEIDRDLNATYNLEQLGKAIPEVTPAEMEALASRNISETAVGEAGTLDRHVCLSER
jgi:hypothetical protein